MFSSCSMCRRRLARRAEGTLSRMHWASLEAHLSRCAECRRIDEADRAMHLMLSRSRTVSSRMTMDAASAFDDRVLDLVLNEPVSLWRRWLDELKDRLRQACSSARFLFIGQVAGGALAAAVITTSCIVVAQHPYAAHHGDRVNNRPEVTANQRWLNGPPVPLEALLDSPSPRAAMLWTRPSGSASVAMAKRDRARKLDNRYRSGGTTSTSRILPQM